MTSIDTLRTEYRSLRTRAFAAGATPQAFLRYVEQGASLNMLNAEDKAGPDYDYPQACCEAAFAFTVQAEHAAEEAAYEAACDAEAAAEAAMPQFVGLIPGTAHVGE